MSAAGTSTARARPSLALRGLEFVENDVGDGLSHFRRQNHRLG
jgi:hypothetical protein